MTPSGVAFVHDYNGAPGGAERYLELLAEGLRARGVATAALAFSPDGPAGAALAQRWRSRFDAVTVARRAGPVPVRRVLRASGAEVLHWNLADPFAFEGAAWTLLPWGVPSVLTDHLPMLRARPWREVPRARANRGAGAVIVVGPAAAEAARAHWGPMPNLRTVVNGVAARPGRDRSGPRGRLRLLVVGRLTAQKDPGFALEVLAGLGPEEAELRYVGEGPLRADLEGRVAALGLGDRVSFAGFCEDPSSELDAADVLLSPAGLEGAPLVPREAMAAGVPVVLSDIGPHRELVEGWPALPLAPLGDAAAWRGAVRLVGRDLGGASSQARQAAGRFGLDQMIDGTVEAYAAALATRR